jgi:crossover junction endodeoxyribonuclease RuvC
LLVADDQLQGAEEEKEEEIGGCSRKLRERVSGLLKDIRWGGENQYCVIVIGIDPGAANTGFGVVRTVGNRMVALDGGVIETPPEHPPAVRLAEVHRSLAQLVDWHEPDAMALEDLYFGRNVGSALAVGQARGVAMLAAGQSEVPCFDYTPQAVKKAVCGSGSADKGQVQRMVASLLNLSEPPASDHAADAFAVAICHAGSMPSQAAAAQLGRNPVGTQASGHQAAVLRSEARSA